MSLIIEDPEDGADYDDELTVVVDDWLERCKARPSYAAIADYLEPAYIEIMQRCGRETRARVAAELAAGG